MRERMLKWFYNKFSDDVGFCCVRDNLLLILLIVEESKLSAARGSVYKENKHRGWEKSF